MGFIGMGGAIGDCDLASVLVMVRLSVTRRM
jgi:hypothetical protein